MLCVSLFSGSEGEDEGSGEPTGRGPSVTHTLNHNIPHASLSNFGTFFVIPSFFVIPPLSSPLSFPLSFSVFSNGGEGRYMALDGTLSAATQRSITLAEEMGLLPRRMVGRIHTTYDRSLFPHLPPKCRSACL